MRPHRVAIPTQRPNHPRPTHPQLPYHDDSVLDSGGVRAESDGAVFGVFGCARKKKERSRGALNFLALGGARSSTPSLHHPGAGDVTVHCPGSLSQPAMCFKGDA